MELTFAAPALLWALPVAALPLIFHIRARAKERAVDFPGAFFLQNPALPSAERRRRLEDVLLLVLRVFLLAFAVLALAGPRVKGWGASGADATGSEAVVLVLDDSPSVSLRRDADGLDVWAQTLESLRRTLGADPRRRVAVETASGQGRALGEGLRAGEGAGGAAHMLPPAFSSGDRTAALTRALSVLLGTSDDRRTVVLVSDFARNEEEGDGEALAARWSAALKAFAEPGAPALVAVELPPVARQWTLGPLQTWGSAAAERVPVAGPPFRMRLSVRAAAGSAARTLRVFGTPLRAGDEGPVSSGASQALLERRLILGLGEAAEIEVPAVLPEPGTLWVTARLEGEDDLPFDDRSEAVVVVHAKRACALWDLRAAAGAPRQDAAGRAAAFGLDPLGGSEASRVKLVKAETPRADRIAPGTLLLALYDPRGPVLNPQESEKLRGALEAGATLVWVPDLTGAPEEWPVTVPGRAVFADVLMPRALEGAEAAAKRSDAPAGGGWRVADAGTGHPLLRPFAGRRNGDLSGVRFGRRVRMGIEADRARQPAVHPDTVLARFDDGLPALVYQPLGAGGIYELAFGIEPRDGLAASPAWPVLLAELAELAAGDGLGAEPGPPLTVGASLPAAWPVSPRPSARNVIWEGPWNLQGAVPGSTHRRPGRWELELPARAEQLALSAPPAPGPYRFSCAGAERWVTGRVSPAESSLERLPEAILRQLAETARASGGGSVREVGELSRALARLLPGKSLTPWCWVFFALAMGVELLCLVQRRRMS
jgi:hypothetical protein